jgi:hypothetical protein
LRAPNTSRIPVRPLAECLTRRLCVMVFGATRNCLCYSQRMQITLNIPDDLARQVAPEGKDPARVALEALALEGYRSELLSESALRQMLGFQTRMEVHAFLKQHGVYLHYDVSDLQQDRATALQVRRVGQL